MHLGWDPGLCHLRVWGRQQDGKGAQESDPALSEGGEGGGCWSTAHLGDWPSWPGAQLGLRGSCFLALGGGLPVASAKVVQDR